MNFLIPNDTEKNEMKGYKAFKKGMICDPTGKRPFQYAENTVFEQDEEAEICSIGFHYCKEPLDVLAYYPLVDENGDMSEFAEVESLEEPKTDDGKKYCTKKLKIGAKLSFSALVQASVGFELEKNSAQIGSSGDGAKINSSGEDSVICCTGVHSVVRAKKGSWITLAEWEYDEGKRRYIPKCVKTEQVDGERIKENVFYRLVNGEFTEVKG